MKLQRRWFIDGKGNLLRLDDQAILSQFEIYRVKSRRRAEIMDGLLAMEYAALETLNRGK